MGTLRKILLVDDDDDLREALSEQLVMTEDFDVFEARTGAEGMEKAKAGLYDLVILDVGLPDTDGRELCRHRADRGANRERGHLDIVPQLQRGAIGADGGDRLVDLMCYAGCDLTKDRQAIGLDEILLHALQAQGKTTCERRVWVL